MTVCDNLGEHLIGNIYIKVRRKNQILDVIDLRVVSLRERRDTRSGRSEHAMVRSQTDLRRTEVCEDCLQRMNESVCSSPVTDFKEASCRQYELGEVSEPRDSFHLQISLSFPVQTKWILQFYAYQNTFSRCEETAS